MIITTSGRSLAGSLGGLRKSGGGMSVPRPNGYVIYMSSDVHHSVHHFHCTTGRCVPCNYLQRMGMKHGRWMSFSTYRAKSVPHEQTRSFEFPSTAVGFCGFESSFHHDQWPCEGFPRQAVCISAHLTRSATAPSGLLCSPVKGVRRRRDLPATSSNIQQHPATTKQTKPFEVPR